MSPKLYFADSGLACHLLGIESESMLNRSPFLGPSFEGFVASEIAKLQLAAGKPRALYYFRDQQGLEVDFVVPLGARRLSLIEAKASRTVTPVMAEPLRRLAKASTRYQVSCYVVHRRVPGEPQSTALAVGTRAVSVDQLATVLFPRRR